MILVSINLSDWLLVFDHQRITYDELIHEVDKASSQYSMINEGEKVGLLSNHPIKI